jgi:prepilin-type N-terminal cleavage/methylation domain-containing protein
MVKKSNGFTLIELLVVIAIIGILATIVIINVTAARAKAVSARILADVNNAQKTATTCMISGYYLYNPASDKGVGWLAGGVSNFSLANIEGKLICASDISTVSPSSPSDVPGVWPSISTYGVGISGNTWRYRTTATAMTITEAPSFSFIAQDNTNGSINITCTQTGCNKTGW